MHRLQTGGVEIVCRTETPPDDLRDRPRSERPPPRLARIRRTERSFRTREAFLPRRPRAQRLTRAAGRPALVRLAAAIAACSFAFSPGDVLSAATLPQAVFSAVHGRVVGWARSGPEWFVVYLDRAGGGWCGLEGSSWWIALVESSEQRSRVSAERRLGAAMCGNTLAWVRAGRFGDGHGREVAFMLWQTPSIGATTSIYRIAGDRLRLLASFPGDRVTLGAGTVTVSYENSGRSPNGRLENVYRFEDGHYRLLRGDPSSPRPARPHRSGRVSR